MYAWISWVVQAYEGLGGLQYSPAFAKSTKALGGLEDSRILGSAELLQDGT